MIEHDLALGTADGTMHVFVTGPEEEGPHPAVILYMDALGIREELRDMARRLGTVGYVVLLPNLFYRDGGPAFDPAPLAEGRLDPLMVRLNDELSHARVLADTQAMLAWIDRAPTCRAPIGTLGYCMGSRHAFAAAGAFPGRVAAMASLHGGRQVTERPDSPHLLASSIRAECYFGFADGDPLSPVGHRRAIAAALERQGVTHRLEIYEGAAHGFTFPTRHCFDKPAAERAWERIFALFRRNLQKRRTPIADRPRSGSRANG